MTPTGTNLLGLVKHCAAVDFMYFGQVLDRPFPGQDDLDWPEDAELGGGMYAAPRMNAGRAASPIREPGTRRLCHRPGGPPADQGHGEPVAALFRLARHSRR